jgi:anti-sigma factor RsiW
MGEPAHRLEVLTSRLLGPADPELGCEACFDGLDAFVDGELAGLDVHAADPGMRAHLEGCPACREDYESLRALAAQSSQEHSSGAWSDGLGPLR